MSFKSKGIAGAAVLLVIYGGFNLEKRLKPGQVVHSQGTGRSLARSQPIPRASLRLPPRAFVPRDEYESPIIANSEELAVFTAFDRWCERYENGDGKTTQLVNEGEKIALQRRARLAELIVTDPEAALQLAVRYERRKMLPPAIARHLETQVSGLAQYTVIGIAPRTGEPSAAAIEHFVTLNNRSYKASVYGRRIGEISQEKIPIYGIAIGNALAVAEHPVRVLGAVEAADRAANLHASAESQLALPTTACPISQAAGKISYAAEVAGEVRFFCHESHIEELNSALEEAETGSLTRQSALRENEAATQGNKTLLLIRVNFPDDLTEPMTADAAAELMENVDSFYQLNSYGKLSITSTITPLLTMPNSTSYYHGNFERLLSDARSVAAAAGFNSSQFDLDCVRVNEHVVSSQGYIGYMGRKGAAFGNDELSTACHELGHQLGLDHANGWRTTDGSVIGAGRNAPYQNKFDAMGPPRNQGALQFNACHKYRLNWLPDTAVQTIESDGIYHLYPFDVPELEPGRTYALKMVKDSDRDYWIETRQNCPDLTVGDLLFNWSPWYNSGGGTQLLDMTPEGSGGFVDAQLKFGYSFYDPELGVKILPMARNESDPESVDIMVKHVHYLTASRQGAESEAEFTIDVAAPGDYSVWSPTSSGAAGFELTVDGKVVPSSFRAAGTDPGWGRAVESSGTPALISLSAGRHTVRISSTDSLARVQSLLFTDDPTVDLPPVVSPIPDQVSTVGQQVAVSCSIFIPKSGRGTPHIQMSSSDENIVPRQNIVWDEDGKQISITPAPQGLGATIITVTATSADGRSGMISFLLTIIGEAQAAINAAQENDTVHLPSGQFLDHVLINKSLTIVGTSPDETIIDGGGTGIGLVIASNAVVTLKNLTIRNGQGGIRNFGVAHLVECVIEENIGASRGGGGIWNGPGAEMLIERCTINGNRCSSQGGGIYNGGALTILDSTISGNRSTVGNGGGIYNAGQCQLVHCTVAFNRARIGGGGVANAHGVDSAFELGDSIIAGNTADTEQSADLKGGFFSRGYNLVQTLQGFGMEGDTTGNIGGLDPFLGPLQDNGGATQTHALLSGSPAIDAGRKEDLNWDQRGVARDLDARSIANANDGSDIGAFEFEPEASDTEGLDGGGISAQLSIQTDDDGEVILALDASTEAVWILQASADFDSWETLAVLPKGQTTFHDPSAHQSPVRFYRAVRY